MFYCQASFADHQAACCRTEGIPKWYAGVSGALTFLSSSDINENLSFGGFNFSDSIPVTYKVGYTVSGEFGYRIYPNIRAEFEASYRRNALDTIGGTRLQGSPVGVITNAFMGNLYYDYHNSTHFTPYIGGGTGPVRTESSGAGNSWRLGYEYMAGVTYEIMAGTTPFEISLGYRYFNSKEPKFTIKDSGIVYNAKYPIQSDNVELGGKIFF